MHIRQMLVQCSSPTIISLFFQVDIGEGVKPRGYYIQRAGGLFPAPWPQDCADIERIEKLFHFLGILLAKCVQDKRLIDIPLSQPFLKLMCSGEVGHNVTQHYTMSLTKTFSGMTESMTSESSEIMHTDDIDKELILDPPKQRSPISSPWYEGILSEDDLDVIDPNRSRFLKQLRELSAKKQNIMKDKTLTEDRRNTKLQDLALPDPRVPSAGVFLEDLG